MRRKTTIVAAAIFLVCAMNIYAQQRAQNGPAPAPKRASLIFREDFKGRAPGAEGEIQLTQDQLMSPNLLLRLYGPGGKPGHGNQLGLLLNNNEDPATGDIVSYAWSGVTDGNWAILLKDKNNYVDLTGPAKIRWRVRPRGIHQLHPVIKLADGTMWVADYAEPASTYWRENEFFIVDISRWRTLDENTVAEGKDVVWKTNAQLNLSKVDEIGFSDLMRGSGHGTQGNSGVDWIAVYGAAVKR